MGEAGGAELLVGAVEEMLRGGVVAGFEVEGFEQASVDGGGGLTVELLVDDGLGERFEGGLRARHLHGERAGPGDELAEFRVGGGELAKGESGVVTRGARIRTDVGHCRDEGTA